MIEALQNTFLDYLNTQNSEYKRYIWREINHNNKLIGIIGARGVLCIKNSISLLII